MPITPEIIKNFGQTEQSTMLPVGDTLRHIYNYLKMLAEHPTLALDVTFRSRSLELVACSGNPELARLISAELWKNVDMLMERKDDSAPVTRFANGEVRPVYDPKTLLIGKHAMILQSFSPPWEAGQPNINDQVVELMIACHQAIRASAGEVTAIMPHMAYDRSDKKDMPKGAIAARVILDALLAQGVHRFVAIDPHKDQIAGFAPIFDIIYSSALFIPQIIKKIGCKNIVFIAADTGATAMAKAYSRRILGHDMIGFISKSRDPSSAKSQSVGYSGPDLTNAIPIFIDELISSGETAVDGAALVAQKGVLLDELGQPQIYFIAPHGELIGDALELIRNSAFKKVWITNTIRQRPDVFDPAITGGKVDVYNVAPLLAQQMINIHTGKPMGID